MTHLTANIILNRHKLKPLPFKTGAKQGCPLSLLNVILEAPAIAINAILELQFTYHDILNFMIITHLTYYSSSKYLININYHER